MDNAEVASVFAQIADFLDVLGENPFRVRAYRNAARIVEGLGEPIANLVKEAPDEIEELPGIGADLAGKIVEIVKTGTHPLLVELRAKVPAGVIAIMGVPGVGPKRAKMFYDALGVASVADLERAAKEQKLRALKGVGEKLEAKVLAGCAQVATASGRMSLAEADRVIAAFAEHLRAADGVSDVTPAGSQRRRRETIGDLDLLVSASDAASVTARVKAFPGVREVLASGETKCSVVLDRGTQIDVRIIPPESFGAALVYFTGSKAHNIAMRALALKQGLKVNEYGVFRGDARIAGETEQDVYASVGLAWVPPELREDRGEIDAAQRRALPALVALEDLRGDLRVRTIGDDGARTPLADMAAACKKRKRAWFAICDRARRAGGPTALDEAALEARIGEIEALREKVKGVHVLAGAEVDVLADGSLDLPDALLERLDVVFAAVHDERAMGEEAMTARVLRAIAHPRVSALAHPTGRRAVGASAPLALDFAKVARAAAEHGVLLEIDARPDRLDLGEAQARAAHEAGATLVIDSVASTPDALDDLRYGLDVARRAWCTKAHVANALDHRALARRLRR